MTSTRPANQLDAIPAPCRACPMSAHHGAARTLRVPTRHPHGHRHTLHAHAPLEPDR